jgi:acetyl-CoA C-acetyltransferase
MGEIDYHEINETSSAVALANMKLLDLDPSVVNLHGGAVSLGHPLGMTGARLIMTLISILKVKNSKLGMASVGHGGGGSSSIIIERIY